MSFVIEEPKSVFDPRGGHWMNGRCVPSLLAAIGEVHMKTIGFILPEDESAFSDGALVSKGYNSF